jgi:hypothetical protein
MLTGSGRLRLRTWLVVNALIRHRDKVLGTHRFEPATPSPHKGRGYPLFALDGFPLCGAVIAMSGALYFPRGQPAVNRAAAHDRADRGIRTSCLLGVLALGRLVLVDVARVDPVAPGGPSRQAAGDARDGADLQSGRFGNHPVGAHTISRDFVHDSVEMSDPLE